ncbi:glycosyltransferase family 2 protein [uncultured Hoeflea sp.]|uniref:glycosyltransferase family 2 protein n=1 Tax=uncultured Hoeflea sp. TaxID=538666 RepID=UPI00262EBC2D|nr:glycosyltransferase family 2 protein [uncultured Hoeflea sp.]
MTEISLIIPAYNEAAIIQNTVGELDTFMKREMPGRSFEIIVVDDGSTDGMGAKLDALDMPNLRVERHARNRGRGAGVRTGFAAANGEYVVTLDCDLSYTPDHIPRMLAPLERGEADIVLASAYHPDGMVKNVPWMRAKISYYGNKVLSAGVRGQLYTLTCIVRAYRREVVKKLELISDSKDLHLEIIQKANLFGYRLAEIPATLDWRDKARAKRVGKGGAFPLFALSGTIASHLVYNYVLRPGATLFLPVAALSVMIFVGTMMLLGSWIMRTIELMDRGFFVALYAGLRDALLNGSLTLMLTAGSTVVLLVFFAFYFQSLQSKKQFEELYILMARMNDRLKDLERDKSD